MKKFAAIALAVILAMSSMFATVGSAAQSIVITGSLSFDGFEIVDPNVVVDVENGLIYGLEPGIPTSDLDKYLKEGSSAKDMIEPTEPYLGTGSVITLIDKDDMPHDFKIVIFGDVTGDSVTDVLDAAVTHLYASGLSEPSDVEVTAADVNFDGEITEAEYQAQVNVISGSKEGFDQKQNGTPEEVDVEVDDQVFEGENAMPVIEEKDVKIVFNNGEVLDKHYYVESISYKPGEAYGEAVVAGKGLFSGKTVIKFKMVSLLEKIVGTVNEVIADAGLQDVVSVIYDAQADASDVKVAVDASKAIRGNFKVNMNALNGLLAEIDEFKAENLAEANLTVGNFNIADNGDFDRSAIKALVFDVVKGIFCDIANADDNTVKSYSGSIAANATLPLENFNVDVVMTGAEVDIARVKDFAKKISRYVAFNVVDGNAVIDIKMPASFATSVVDVLGDGDIAAAKAQFDALTIGGGFELLALVTPEDISASSAAEINQLLEVVSGLDGVVNKALGEVTEATVTDVNGNVYELLSGDSFYIEDSDNKFGAIVEALNRIVNDDLLGKSVGNFANDGIYTVEVDAAISYRNISEKVIVNFDLFGAAETPTIIEETATYFSDIIKTLGLANVAKVSYDEENCRALATLNARELATNLTLNENAFEGLYTDIKGFFDETYGTSTIVVGGKTIVTNGVINKSALKDFIFSAATGFFQDAANLGENNVLRSFPTVVTEADGTVHNFDLDFALEGSQADVERVASIAAKVAKYVSFEVVNGNAVVNVALPEGMRNVIIDVFGEGKGVEAAKAKLNGYTLDEAFTLLGFMDAETISEANAKDIEALVSLICSVDGILNKVLSKVTYAKATTVNGASYDLLSGEEFVVDGDDIAALVGAVQAQLGAVKDIRVAEFANPNGTYTGKFDVAVSIGGIKETVILNLDVFGDAEQENAIEDTVDYVGEIFAELGIANFASVELAEGKAVASFNATELVRSGLNFNDAALDGLFTEVKDYFKANFSDSTIKVGPYDLVIDGVISKPAVKDFIFDFATGFFTDIANMDAETFRSYNTVVIDGEGNVEEFAFDFNLEGEPAHIEKIQTISAKVAAHVSFTEVDGNAAVNVTLPAGMKALIVEEFGDGKGVEAAQAKLNGYTVNEAFTLLSFMDAETISEANADEINMIVEMVGEMEGVVNKVVANISSATVEVNGEAKKLIADDAEFDLGLEPGETATVAHVVTAIQAMIDSDLGGVDVGNFMNKDGSYTITCNVTAKGITEKVTITVDIF